MVVEALVDIQQEHLVALLEITPLLLEAVVLVHLQAQAPMPVEAPHLYKMYQLPLEVVVEVIVPTRPL